MKHRHERYRRSTCVRKTARTQLNHETQCLLARLLLRDVADGDRSWMRPTLIFPTIEPVRCRSGSPAINTATCTPLEGCFPSLHQRCLRHSPRSRGDRWSQVDSPWQTMAGLGRQWQSNGRRWQDLAGHDLGRANNKRLPRDPDRAIQRDRKREAIH